MFRLSQYVRSVILPSVAPNFELTTDAGVPPPVQNLARGDVVQLGRMLMVKLDRVPDGATPVNQHGPVEFHGPDGVYILRASGERSR